MGLVRLPALVATILAILGLTACASSPSPPAATIDGGNVRLSVSTDDTGWLGDLLDGQLDCSSRADGALGSLLAALDRGGPRARATVRDGDGSLSGRRRGKRLELVAAGGDGRVEVKMPWAAAECLLGRSTDLGKALAGLEVELIDADGHRTALRLD